MAAPVKFFPDERGYLARVRKPAWDVFFHERTVRIFERGGKILDIGGGLRVDMRGGTYDPEMAKRYLPYLSRPNIEFRVSDLTDKYGPDYIEDIHALSFPDATFDAIFCNAVFEHIEDPKRAGEEVLRVLRPKGTALLYLPFLYRYHAHPTDYSDFFRFTKDGIGYIFREAASIEVCPVRGYAESLVKLSPFSPVKPLHVLARCIDECSSRTRTIGRVQTTGYHVYLER